MLSKEAPGEVFRAFLKLGLTSFGGPIAHLGYFREELVIRRKWIDEKGYADLVACGKILPERSKRASSMASRSLSLFFRSARSRSAQTRHDSEFPVGI